ncbi:unnamed protein product [Rotaria sp. Silwood2]|nr:unnamed protein product [Rotaria sp. Silwood2]
MEVDSNCLFVDVGNCDGSEIPCHDFLKPHVDTDNHSSLLDSYCFNVARRHVNVDDKGVVVDDTITPTIRYDDYQLEHFIELLVSPHICTDMPFGDTKLYLSIDEILLIPLIILNLAPQRIIIQYYKLL